MNVHEIDLEAEVACVRGELIAFRDVCLPAFFGRGVPRNLPISGLGGPQWLELHEWRRAVDLLIEALPGAERSGRLDLKVFAFLYETCDATFSIEAGRVVWQCGIGVMNISKEIAENTLLGMGEELHPDECTLQSLVDRLPEVERWLLGLPLEFPELHNVLCTTLPVLVDSDPEFVGRALDPATWRCIVFEGAGRRVGAGRQRLFPERPQQLAAPRHGRGGEQPVRTDPRPARAPRPARRVHGPIPPLYPRRSAGEGPGG
jgi:hypothetical protein